WGTIQHHVYLLTRAGLLRSVAHGRHHRFFLPGHGAENLSEFSILLRGRVRNLAQAVIGKPGIGQSELTSVMGMSRKVFREYAELLTGAGLVQEVARSKFRVYYPTQSLLELSRHPAWSAITTPTPPEALAPQAMTTEPASISGK